MPMDNELAVSEAPANSKNGPTSLDEFLSEGMRVEDVIEVAEIFAIAAGADY